MIWIVSNWRAVTAGIVILASFWAGYVTGCSHIQGKWDAEKLQQRDAQDETIKRKDSVKPADSNSTIVSLRAGTY